MEITLSAPILAGALSRLQPAINKRIPLDICRHVLLRVEGEALVLTATDLDLVISTTIQIDSAKDAIDVCLPYDVLAAAVKGQRGPFRIGVEGVEGVFDANGSTRMAQVLPAEDYPVMPSLAGWTWEAILPADTLVTALRSVATAVATDDKTRAILAYLQVSHADGHLVLAATEGHRLHTMALYSYDGPKKPVYLSTAVVAALLRLAGKKPVGDVHLSIREDLCQLVYGDTTILGRTIAEGKFPDVGKILPTSHEGNVAVRRSDIRQALDSLPNAMTKAGTYMIPAWAILSFPGYGITCSIDVPEAKASARVEAVVDGEPPEKIAFNLKYLRDVIAACPDDSVTLRFGDDLRMMVVESRGFFGAVMPARIKEKPTT